MGAKGIGHIRYLCDLVHPTIGVVLNVGHAHVGEFGGVEAIATAKGELVEALPGDGVAVLNADDAVVARHGRPHDGTGARPSDAGTGADVRAVDVQLDSGRPRQLPAGGERAGGGRHAGVRR